MFKLMHGGIPHHHLPRGGTVNAGNHIDEGGFAAARFADDGYKLAGAHLQIEAFERGKRAGCAFKGFYNMPQVNKKTIAIYILAVSVGFIMLEIDAKHYVTSC